MLPPGHMAAGYLAAEALLGRKAKSLPDKQRNKLVWWGIFLAFAPDLDTFYSFYKSSSLTVNPAVANHRIYLTHTPLLWLIAGLLIFFLAKKPFYRILGLLVWLASWSHFLLDSIEYGVRWLWPINNKLYAIIPGSHSVITGGMEARSEGVLSFWLGFLRSYSHSVTFYLEILIILLALIIYIKLSRNHAGGDADKRGQSDISVKSA
ncbi:MAG: metal-dependent hydrolase [Patescibacteria group bacterium]|nr:metal-dependent hydrolase [Patescibacteria group bacterium]